MNKLYEYNGTISFWGEVIAHSKEEAYEKIDEIVDLIDDKLIVTTREVNIDAIS